MWTAVWHLTRRCQPERKTVGLAWNDPTEEKEGGFRLDFLNDPGPWGWLFCFGLRNKLTLVPSYLGWRKFVLLNESINGSYRLPLRFRIASKLPLISQDEISKYLDNLL
jgi:hypothetical protein